MSEELVEDFTEEGIVTGEEDQEVETEVEAEVETPVAVIPPKVEQQLKRMIRAKVDGKEFEQEIDFENEEELIKMVQFSNMAQKRAQETAELRKVMTEREESVKELLTQLQTNPLEILKRVPNVDLKTIAASILNQHLEEESLTPEEKRIKELESEIKKIRENDQKEKEKLEKERTELLRSKFKEEFDRDLKDAISENGLKYNPAVVSRMVQYMEEINRMGLKASFKELAPLVKTDLMQDISDILGDMPSEALEKLIRSEKLDELVVKRTPKTPVKKVVPPSPNDIKNIAAAPKEHGKRLMKSIPARDFFRSIK